MFEELTKEGEGTRVVTCEDLAQVVRKVGTQKLMEEMIGALEHSLQRFDEAATDIRLRDGFTYERPVPGVLEWMPVMHDQRHAVVKMVGYNPLNPAQGLPTIVSTLGLYDLATGRLRVLMEGIFATALRTGAASAVASRCLASPDSRCLGLIGAGAQAVTQLHALSLVFPLRQVLVYDINAEVSESFPDRCRAFGLDVRTASRAEVERSSDILCTVTSAEVGGEPVISDRDLKPWLHVNAVGSDLPGKIELPKSLLKRSLVCPDFLPQAQREGECQQLEAADIGPSLVELVKDPGAFESHRASTTVFDSTGYALEDFVAMEVLLRHVCRLGLGSLQPIEDLSGDPRNPYAFALPMAVESDRATALRAGS